MGPEFSFQGQNTEVSVKVSKLRYLRLVGVRVFYHKKKREINNTLTTVIRRIDERRFKISSK